MNIYEATKKACEEKRCITRLINGTNFFGSKIMPTNSPDCCIVIKDNPHKHYRCWNPTREDLLSDDWIVTD